MFKGLYATPFTDGVDRFDDVLWPWEELEEVLLEAALFFSSRTRSSMNLFSCL